MSLTIFDRQFNRKTASPLFPVWQVNSSTVKFGQLFGDTKPQAKVLFAISWGISPIKPVKNIGLVLIRDSAPFINYLQDKNLSLGGDRSADMNGAPWWRVIDGVVQQYQKKLTDPFRIADDLRKRGIRKYQVKPDAFFPTWGLEGIEQINKNLSTSLVTL